MNETVEIEKIMETLDHHFARNMGQKSLYLKDTVATIQKRGTEYVMYMFDNKNSTLELDIKEATRFKKFTRDELIEFLKENYVGW